MCEKWLFWFVDQIPSKNVFFSKEGGFSKRAVLPPWFQELKLTSSAHVCFVGSFLLLS